MKSQESLLLSKLTVEETILRCGELKIDKTQIPLLLAGRLNRTEQQNLSVNLSSPGSEEYSLYAEGFAKGEFELATDLRNLIANPKAKDAFKNLSTEQLRKGIDKKIYENFGICLDS